MNFKFITYLNRIFLEEPPFNGYYLRNRTTAVKYS